MSLRASRVASAAIAALAMFTMGAVLTLSLPLAIDVVAAIALLGWARRSIRRHATRTSPRAVADVLVSSDALIAVRYNDGQLAAGYVHSSTFVHPWFTSIVWKPDGARTTRSIPIVHDMLGLDEFRQLRVMLRHGRREVAAGDPASQA
ncbi:MAG TPA: hypothetical protein VNE58_03305 [Casimicrobiaceae bacterium]|nr:hypothetical protein [Casimicrobiaceae bacterium]